MRLLILTVIVAAILSTCNCHEGIEAAVKAEQTLEGLLPIAKAESDSSNKFIDDQTPGYQKDVEDNNNTLNKLLEQFAQYAGSRRFVCIIKKYDYRLSVRNARGLIRRYHKKNVTAELERKFAREQTQLKTNVEDIEKMQEEAKALEGQPGGDKKIKGMTETAKKMILRAHRRFYDNMEKYMKMKIDQLDNRMARVRGGITKRGKRMMKCAV